MQRTLERARVVSVRLTRSEHQTAQANAQAAGAPIGAWLRLRMLGAEDDRERLAGLEVRMAALEAAAAEHTEALAKLERAVEKNFGKLADAMRARAMNPGGAK